MIRSPETMVKVLDCLTTNPSPTKAARAIGAQDPKLVWKWGIQSAAKQAEGCDVESSGFGVNWPDPDGPLIWFHEAFMQASKIFLALASMEHMALIGPDAGSKRVVVQDGKVQWTPDPKIASDALSMSDEDWWIVYGDRKRSDIWLRDENNCLVPLQVTDALPAQLKIHLLRSLLPSQFNPEQRSTSDVHHHGGVLVIGEHKPTKPASALRDDLEARLAAIRAKGPAHGKPNAPVQVMGRGESGPIERTSAPYSDDAAQPLDQHPRAYTVPALPAPKPQEATPDYSRKPTRNLNAQDRTGNMPPGGFSRTTGRAT